MMHETQIDTENCQTMIIFCVHCNMHSPLNFVGSLCFFKKLKNFFGAYFI
jgi:hypothetical protein